MSSRRILLLDQRHRPFGRRHRAQAVPRPRYPPGLLVLWLILLTAFLVGVVQHLRA